MKIATDPSIFYDSLRCKQVQRINPKEDCYMLAYLSLQPKQIAQGNEQEWVFPYTQQLAFPQERLLSR